MTTKTNWLKLLRKDILSRQSLYPDAGYVGKLTRTNWLIKLRDDIIERQTLSPGGPSVGLITKTNFLLLLKENMLTAFAGTASPIRPAGSLVNKTELINAINSAKTNLNSTLISSDGSDILEASPWITQETHDKLNGAIIAAEIIFNKPTATQKEINSTISALNSEVDMFNAAKPVG